MRGALCPQKVGDRDSLEASKSIRSRVQQKKERGGVRSLGAQIPLSLADSATATAHRLGALGEAIDVLRSVIVVLWAGDQSVQTQLRSLPHVGVQRTSTTSTHHIYSGSPFVSTRPNMYAGCSPTPGAAPAAAARVKTPTPSRVSPP